MTREEEDAVLGRVQAALDRNKIEPAIVSLQRAGETWDNVPVTSPTNPPTRHTSDATAVLPKAEPVGFVNPMKRWKFTWPSDEDMAKMDYDELLALAYFTMPFWKLIEIVRETDALNPESDPSDIAINRQALSLYLWAKKKLNQ